MGCAGYPLYFFIHSIVSSHRQRLRQGQGSIYPTLDPALIVCISTQQHEIKYKETASRDLYLNISYQFGLLGKKQNNTEEKQNERSVGLEIK